jgi:hypothetical protein
MYSFKNISNPLHCVKERRRKGYYTVIFSYDTWLENFPLILGLKSMTVTLRRCKITSLLTRLSKGARYLHTFHLRFVYLFCDNIKLYIKAGFGVFSITFSTPSLYKVFTLTFWSLILWRFSALEIKVLKLSQISSIRCVNQIHSLCFKSNTVKKRLVSHFELS